MIELIPETKPSQEIVLEKSQIRSPRRAARERASKEKQQP
jgi:hypothetical protein